LAIAKDVRGRWVARLAERLDARIQRTLSRYTKAYLRYMVAATRYIEMKGLTTRGEFHLESESVFVTLSMEPRAPHTLSTNPVPRAQDHDENASESIWGWIARMHDDRSPLAIVGPPGCGKTTLLRHVAHTLASGRRDKGTDVPSHIPILVNLRDHQKWAKGASGDLAEFLRLTLPSLDAAEPPRWLETNLRRGRIALLLDGLDEVADATARKTMVDWLEKQASAHDGNVILLTSRPFGYRDNPVSGATVVQVRPFTHDQTDSFIRRWYMATSARSHGGWNDSSRMAAEQGAVNLLSSLHLSAALYELGSNPLLLTMIANVHHYRGALPGSRSELYSEMCEVFLGKRHQARGIEIDMPARQRQVVLQKLAYDMMLAKVRDMTAVDAAASIKEALARVASDVVPENFLRSIEASAGLVIERERGLYSFAHPTFQEFLAAHYVADNGLVSELSRLVTVAWWREVVRLYCAISDASDLVRGCLGYPADADMLALAGQCVSEARQIEPALRREVRSRLSPPDARTRRAARAVAALARLQLRIGEDRPLEPGVFISHSPISWLEYQYFLDCQTGEPRIPDHWVEAVFPEVSIQAAR
jgi:hypothetical protein